MNHYFGLLLNRDRSRDVFLSIATNILQNKIYFYISEKYSVIIIDFFIGHNTLIKKMYINKVLHSPNVIGTYHIFRNSVPNIKRHSE